MRALRRWHRAGRASLELFRGALSPRSVLERAARYAICVRAEPLATGQRVLDLCCGDGRGAAHLRSAGASEVVGLTASRSDQRAAQALARPGLTFRPEPLLEEALGVFDLLVCIACSRSPEAFLPAKLDRLAPGGQIVVAVPPEVSGAWRDLLQQHFLRVETVHLLGSEADGSDLRFQEAPVSADAVYDVLTASAALRHLPPGPRRLHVGAGSQRLEGWINVDIRPFPGVDLVADVTRGLELTGIDAVFAEHFLEHLAIDHALEFLTAVQRMLTAGGRLRLSTPNLDWVWQTHYRLEAPPDDKVNAAVALNRAFHGWEHKFVWNRETLELALLAVGFRDLIWHRHGESDVEHLRDLERHETYDDDDNLRHVLIVEARKGKPDLEGLKALRERLQRDFLDHVAGY